MSLSPRVERLFAHARKIWAEKPKNSYSRDFHYAATELYADREVWERAALSAAYMLKNAPVIIEPDDGLIGRAFHYGAEKPVREDPVLRDYLVQVHGYQLGEEVYRGYSALAERHLVTEPVRGHITWNWAKMLRLGTTGMKAEFRDALEKARDEEAEHFYTGVLIMLDALEDWSDQHAARLEEMGRFEQAELCRRVPRYPAQSFREAMQAFFIQYIAVFIENPFGGNGPGQFDKIMWPYLKKDIEAGVCTLEDAREMIDELFIRMDDRVATNDLWNEMIIVGGTHKDGSGAVSPLSKIMVDSMIDLNITHPTLYMRVPENADDDYWRLCAHYVKHGNNRAQIYYDPNMMAALMKTNNAPMEDACEYGVGGCLEVGIQGMCSDYLQNAWVNVALMLELCITGGFSIVENACVDTGGIDLPGLSAHDSFESFYQNFCEYANRLIGMSFDMIEKYSMLAEKNRPAYLISGMIDDCLARGRHMHAGGARYHDYGMTPMGLPNVIDGLLAIRTAVFEEKICTADELVAAMKANFAGCEKLQRKLRALPKYGQNNDEADAFACRVVEDIAKMYVTRKNRFGGIFRPMVLSFVYVPLAAAQLGASADGNNAGTMVAQALTPQARSMTCGITAAMNSCMKLPFTYFSGGASTMWDMDPAWASEELIADLMKTYFEGGAQIFQGNTTDVAELIEAQKHPEDYGHLIVRVGGFSARFVGLDPGLQTDIINRRRHRG